jgi:site-specific DNA-methyltransferase (adenine-specific)
MVAMARMKDKQYDLAICDPPYGLSKSELIPGSLISSTGVKRRGRELGMHKLSTNKPRPAYFKQLFRVSKNQIIWGENYFKNFGPGRIVWVKNNPVLSGAELAYHSFGKGAYVFTHTWSGFCRNGEKISCIHPTQKPVALYEWLLTHYAKPGDKILDTHGGSGSICIACHDLGFDLDWYEIDAEYFQAAKERLERHQKQEVLPLTETPIQQETASLLPMGGAA